MIGVNLRSKAALVQYKNSIYCKSCGSWWGYKFQIKQPLEPFVLIVLPVHSALIFPGDCTSKQFHWKVIHSSKQWFWQSLPVLPSPTPQQKCILWYNLTTLYKGRLGILLVCTVNTIFCCVSPMCAFCLVFLKVNVPATHIWEAKSSYLVLRQLWRNTLSFCILLAWHITY